MTISRGDMPKNSVPLQVFVDTQEIKKDAAALLGISASTLNFYLEHARNEYFVACIEGEWRYRSVGPWARGNSLSG